MRMIPVYLGLLLAALIASGFALASALAVPGVDPSARGDAVQRHQLLGLVASVLLLVVQCAVFVYFLGTGKAIKVAVEQRGLDPDLARQTRKMKGKTFPFATFAAVSVVVGAVLAGAASPSAHATAIAIAVGLALLAAPFELRSLAQNRRLMDRTGDALDRAESAAEHAPDPDAAPPAFLFGRTLLLVAVSTWLVFAYRAVVMRSSPEPWPAYVLVSAITALLGVPLLVAGRRRAPSLSPKP